MKRKHKNNGLLNDPSCSRRDDGFAVNRCAGDDVTTLSVDKPVTFDETYEQSSDFFSE